MTDIEVLQAAEGVRTTPAGQAGASAGGSTDARALASARFEKVAARALEVGLRRLSILAWRDLDDPEAGGSELHAHQVASVWARGGLDVTIRTSAVAGAPVHATRNGYRVKRKGGRLSVYPRSVVRSITGRGGRPDGLLEIWHGMPFFSPLWARCPRISFAHHVHAETWRVILSPGLARVGELGELHLARHVYRRSQVLTDSPSSRDDLISLVGLRPENVHVVPCGVHPMFSPAGDRSPDPLVVAVGRLVPVKRFGLLIESLLTARRTVPRLQAVIVGEGVERPKLEAQIAAAGAGDWIRLAGHVSDQELVDTYRRAWVLASTSQREGWNMTITEAAACGVPAVATHIVGHRDTVAHDESGLLTEPGDLFTESLVRVLTDSALHARLARGALDRAEALTWEATSAGILGALVDEAQARG